MGQKPTLLSDMSTTAIRDRRPLPLIVRDGIRRLIAERELALGDRLPSEAELSGQFQVARTTVREALKLLEQDGLIDVRQGAGRFISFMPPLEQPITRLEGVTQMLRGMGFEVTNKVLDVSEVKASAQEITALRLYPGATVIRLERMRLQGEIPLIYSVDVVRRDAIEGDIAAKDWTGSLIDMLAERGLAITSAQTQFLATTLPRSIAQRLQLDPKEPWLLFVETMFTEGGQPIICGHDYYRGDAISFNVIRRREVP